ncbi:MAG: diguanylate cyclase [Spirochaetales bacterium]|nr:diguanylate cyclase [Spirochaetales bacterium]
MFFIFLLSLALLGCAGENPDIFSLKGQWEYRTGFNPDYFEPEGSTGWKPIEMPQSVSNFDDLSGYTGIITLRKSIPPEINKYFENNLNVGLRTGSLSPAGEIYFNHFLLGKMGSVEPYQPGNDIESVFLCLGRYYIRDSNNYIYIKLLINDDFEYVGLKGPDITIGLYDAVYNGYYTAILLSFIIMTIYFIVGSNFIFIGIRRPKELYNLYFGAFLILLSVFFSVNSEVKGILFGTNSFLISKIDQVSLMILTPLFILFLTWFYKKKHTRPALIFTAFFGVLALIDFFGPQSVMSFNFYLWSFGIAAGFIYLMVLTILQITKKNPDAVIMLISLVIVIIGTFIDNFVSIGIISYVTIGKFLYVFVVLGLALVQSNRYVVAFDKIEEMNVTLEEEVERRTQDLKKAMAQLEQKNKQLEDVAVKDSLTGLFNHKMIFELLNNVYSSAKRFNKPVTVIMIDIDHFKQVNDVFGHQTGDMVILRISEILKSKLRLYDNKFKITVLGPEDRGFDPAFPNANLAGRYGGDEFVLILPHCGKKDAKTIAERLHESINMIWVEQTPDLKITASLGVCTLENPDDNVEIRQLMVLVDDALYKSKEEGRNRISYAEYGAEEHKS